jgi:hypothetical protein
VRQKPIKDGWLLVTQEDPYRFRLCPTYEEALATVHVWAAMPEGRDTPIIIQKADKESVE